MPPTGKKRVCTPEDDNESPPPDEPDIPHVHADDDVDAEGFLKDIEVMDINEPEKPRQEHHSKDINNFFQLLMPVTWSQERSFASANCAGNE